MRRRRSLRSLSVVKRRGPRPWPFNNLRKNRTATCRSRRGRTGMSMTSPPWSTARQRCCRCPWMVTTSSSRYQRPFVASRRLEYRELLGRERMTVHRRPTVPRSSLFLMSRSVRVRSPAPPRPFHSSKTCSLRHLARSCHTGRSCRHDPVRCLPDRSTGCSASDPF